MKKTLTIILSFAIFAVFAVPIVVSGQFSGGTAECCRLAQDITVNDLTYATSGADCAFVGGPTTFASEDVIGAGDCVNSAPEPDKCVLKNVETDLDWESPEWGTVCLLNAIYNITNWIFYFFLAIAILIGVIAGYMFMTAAGDPTKIEKARALLMYMVIGVIIAALAKVIPTLVRTIVGF